MRVVFDANILIDAGLLREPFCFIAEHILLLVSQKKIEGFVTSNSITDIFYVIRKILPINETKSNMLKLLKSLSIINVDSDDCYSAFYHQIADVEDALLVVCADKIKADYIITRDDDLLKQKSTIKIVTPDDFMLIYNKSL
jgi:putative PIN family toxin of toxin-antitoxin system